MSSESRVLGSDAELSAKAAQIRAWREAHEKAPPGGADEQAEWVITDFEDDSRMDDRLRAVVAEAENRRLA